MALQTIMAILTFTESKGQAVKRVGAQKCHDGAIIYKDPSDSTENRLYVTKASAETERPTGSLSLRFFWFLLFLLISFFGGAWY